MCTQAVKFTEVLQTLWDYGPLGVEFKNNVKKLGGKNSYRNQNIM